MKAYRNIAEAVADESASRACRRVRIKLQRSNYSGSGIDSGLISTWDEICVQVQFQESGFWGFYVDLIRGFVNDEVAELKDHEATALTLRALRESMDDSELEQAEADYPAYWTHEISTYLVSRVLSDASDWSNARIRRYLEQ